MKASELRIGNYLQDRENRLCKVESIDIAFIDSIVGEAFKAPAIYGGLTSLPHKPIPLTEEILLKCGFELIDSYFKKGELDMFYCLKYYPHLKGYYFYIEYTDSPFEKDYDVYYPVSCTYKHLHQLQNLYFALTSEELEVNL